MNFRLLFPTLLLACAADVAFGQIVIDRDNPLSGQTLKARNRQTVTVQLINKGPFESCKAENKREELPQADALAAVFDLLAKASGFLNFFRVQGAIGIAATPTEEEKNFNLMRENLEKAIAKFQEDLNAQVTAAAVEQRELRTFFRTRYRDGKGPNKQDFSTDLTTRRGALAKVLETSVPSASGLDAAYKLVEKAFQTYAGSAGAVPAKTVEFTIQLTQLSGAIASLNEAAGRLRKTLEDFRKTQDYLTGLSTAGDSLWTADFRVTSDQNAKITGSVSCTDDLTEKRVTLEPVAYTVLFQDPPRLSLSAGALISSLAERSIQQESVLGNASGTLVITQSEAKPQIIPLSLIQLRMTPVYGKRELTFNFTPGLGLNANNGEAEFFLGGSLGVAKMYISAGAHIGHTLQVGNGFNVGYVSSAALSKLPLSRPWTTGFGIAFTYRLPIK